MEIKLFKFYKTIILLFFLAFHVNISAQDGFLNFEGGEYISIGSNLFDELKEGTIEAKIRIDKSSVGTIFQVGSTVDDTRHFRIYAAKGKLYIQDRYNQCGVEGSTILGSGQFYNIAVSSNGQKWKMYVNGELEELTSIGVEDCPNGGNTGSWFANTLLSTEINEYNLGVLKRSKGEIHFFNGVITEFRIWDHELSSDKIKSNISSLPSKEEKGIQLYYGFNTIKNNTLFDLSSNSINGKLIGFPETIISLNENSSSYEISNHTFLIGVIFIIIAFIFLFRKQLKGYIKNISFNKSDLPKNYIKGFDGLRGISILLVLINHLGWLSVIPYTGFNKRIVQLISGTTGVNIFFAISGFLITSILLAELKKKGSISFKNFFARRFIRLLPPLVVFYLAILIFMRFDYLGKDYLAVFFSFIYIYNFIPRAAHYTSELGSTWSLAVEEQFYLMWPFLLNIFREIRKRILIVVSISIISIIVIYVINDITVVYEINGQAYTRLSKGFFTNRWFFPAVAPIMIGAGLGLLLFNNKQAYQKTFENNYLMLFTAIILFCAALFLSSHLLPIAFIIQAIGVSLFLVWIYFNQQSRLTKFLEFWPLVFIGKISYGLYVYQGLFLGTGPSAEMKLQEYPVNIILTFVVSVISYFFIEKTFMKMKKNFQ